MAIFAGLLAGTAPALVAGMMNKTYFALDPAIDLDILSTAELCYLWNDATNPAALRSDDEHLAARADARLVNTVLQNRSHEWTESDYSSRRFLIERS